MNFGEALDALRMGRKVCRSGWNGKGMWLRIAVPLTDDNQPPGYWENWPGHATMYVDKMMDLPYIYMSTAQHLKVPWLASQSDMLAEDWEIVSEN